jgi:hypothetical protein
MCVCGEKRKGLDEVGGFVGWASCSLLWRVWFEAFFFPCCSSSTLAVVELAFLLVFLGVSGRCQVLAGFETWERGSGGD